MATKKSKCRLSIDIICEGLKISLEEVETSHVRKKSFQFSMGEMDSREKGISG